MQDIELNAKVSLNTTEYEEGLGRAFEEFERFAEFMNRPLCLTLDAMGLNDAARDSEKLLSEAFDGMRQDAEDARASLSDSMDGLLEEMRREDEARAAMLGTATGMAQGLADGYDAFASQVGAYRSLCDELTRMPALAGDGGLRAALSPPTSASNADGLPYVPYDDYLSYLHKGEAVLTAEQAEQWRGARSGGEAAIDYERLAAAIASALSRVSVQMDGETVGNLVTDTVSRNIANGAASSRRYVVIG